MLAVDGVRGGQELARRLAPEHVLAVAGPEVIRGIRLPALELAHRHRPAEPGNARRQISLEGSDVEAMGLAHLDRVGRQRRLAGHAGSLLSEAGLYPPRHA